jgi:hypothetical protein
VKVKALLIGERTTAKEKDQVTLDEIRHWNSLVEQTPLKGNCTPVELAVVHTEGVEHESATGLAQVSLRHALLPLERVRRVIDRFDILARVYELSPSRGKDALIKMNEEVTSLYRTIGFVVNLL